MNMSACTARSLLQLMVMLIGSTAPINAICLLGLGVISLTKKEQRVNEIRYQVVMSYARQLLDEGVITTDCYHEFDTKMQQKYCPSWSKLFTDLNFEIT